MYFVCNNRIKHESPLIVIEWTARNDIDVSSDKMFNEKCDELVMVNGYLFDAHQILCCV